MTTKENTKKIFANDVTISGGADVQDLTWRVHFDDILGSVRTGKLRGIADPDYVQVADDGAGSTGVFGLAFDASSEEEIGFDLQVPHGYKLSTKLRPHVHWHKTTDAVGEVRWGLEYRGSAPLAQMPATTAIIYATSSVTAAADKLMHEVTAFEHIDCDGISACYQMRFFRDATNAADTYAADAVPMYFDFHIEKDTPGSDQEWVK